MFKVWRGAGFLVVPVVAAVFFGAQFATAQFLGTNYWNRQNWPAAAALLVAAATCFVLGRRMNKGAAKGGDHGKAKTHDLLFLRMEWWAVPVAALAIAAFVYGPNLGGPKTVKAAAEKAKKAVVR